MDPIYTETLLYIETPYITMYNETPMYIETACRQSAITKNNKKDFTGILKTIMTIIKIQMNHISTLDNTWEVDMPLNKLKHQFHGADTCLSSRTGASSLGSVS